MKQQQDSDHGPRTADRRERRHGPLCLQQQRQAAATPRRSVPATSTSRPTSQSARQAVIDALADDVLGTGHARQRRRRADA